MNYIYLIILLIGYSCSNSKVEIEQLPIVKGGIEHIQNKSQYGERIDLKGTRIYDLLNSQNPDFQNVFGIAKYMIEEMDSTELRPFDMYILESTIKNESRWHLITVAKNNTNVIDKYDFNPDSLEIKLVYQHSSYLDHDGIAIELIENKSTKDSIYIYNHYLEVFETGEIKFISKSNANSEVFKVLTANQINSGDYSFSEKNIVIKLNLKDGLTPNNYSYKLNISTPEGCIHSYMHLDYDIMDNTIELGSIGDFKLIINDQTILITNTKFKSACEDIFELNYELNKTDSNIR